ncbi:MAG: hypothetical protein ABIQ38_09655 [Ilumatobacteraceae bacterium]
MSNGRIRPVDGSANFERDRALADLARRDAEIGMRAEKRVRDIYGLPTSMDEYHFHHSFAKESQASFQIDWVHQPWLRPFRFTYRHLPKSVRFLIKKLAR